MPVTSPAKEATEAKINVSEWMREPVEDPDDEPYCWMRIVEGGDPEELGDRVAFLEKTPRVRVAPFTSWEEETGKWEFGPYRGYDCLEGLQWMDRRLVEMGYDIGTPVYPAECN